MTATIHEHLKSAYEEIEYVGRPNPHSDPDRVAAIARLFGLASPDPATARVLEIGCGDGANLLPMAARTPGARFTGCDYSSLLVGRARRTAEGLGLANVTLVEGDLRTMQSSFGTYDFIVAHGFYSWVPEDVRDAMLDVVRRCLAPNGIAYLSYNVLPGCLVRSIGWDAIRFESEGIADARQKIEAARRIYRDLADAWSRTGGAAAHLAPELARDAERSEHSFYHDDMSGVNQPVYFTTFVRHLAKHGLGFVAESELGTMGAGGLPAKLQAIVAAADPITREQYLDFARVRRYRQSIVAPQAIASRARIQPEAFDALHVSAPARIVQQQASGSGTGDAIVEALAGRFPGSMSGAELQSELVARGVPAQEARSTALRGCFAGAADLHLRPVPATRHVSERPRVFSVARWQSARSVPLTSLRHEVVHVDDDAGRAVLALADGTRARDAIVAELEPRGIGADAVVHFLEGFALAGLLES